MLQMLTGRKPSPEEQTRRWRQQIRTQERELDKSLRSLAAEETKTKRALRDAARRGDTVSSRVLAREVVRAHHARDRLHTAKAQLNSLSLSVQHQAAMARTVGALKHSTQAMSAVSALVRIPALHATVRDMALEMARAGFIDEAMGDALDSALPDTEDDVDVSDDETNAEVNAVLFEVTAGALGVQKTAPATAIDPLTLAPTVPSTIPGSLVNPQTAIASGSPPLDDDAIASRLNALRES